MKNKILEKWHATLSIEYTEFTPESYKGYVVTVFKENSPEVNVFNTGDPVTDKDNAYAFLKESGIPYMKMSSVDNFYCDAVRHFAGRYK